VGERPGTRLLLRVPGVGPITALTLVGSAQYVLGPFGPDSDLRRCGLRLAERGGKAGLWIIGEAYVPVGWAAGARPGVPYEAPR
jgi:hypothetical protein